MIQADSPRDSFWRRQFAGRSTKAQVIFDVLFGIAMPIVCLVLDPFIFRGSGGGSPLSPYAMAAYIAMGLAMATLAWWLATGWLPSLTAGVLAGGATFATVLGCVLLPLSIAGLAVVIGALGFTPLVTAFVYWRNAARALRAARTNWPAKKIGFVAGCGLALWLALPIGLHVGAKRSVSYAIAAVASDDTARRERGIELLHWLRWTGDVDRLVFAYEREQDADRRQRMANAYSELTGESIDDRLAMLRD